MIDEILAAILAVIARDVRTLTDHLEWNERNVEHYRDVEASRTAERTRPAGPTAAQWRTLRACESSGNYAAVDDSGLYRGAYQFDATTWSSVGGTGDPAAATPAEQDRRAIKLWRARAWQPWPVCGIAASKAGK